MPLTEQTTFSSITILEDGQIQIRRSRRIFDGTELVAEKYIRNVLEPGDDVTSLPLRIRNICAAVWTQQVIDDYAAARAEQ